MAQVPVLQGPTIERQALRPVMQGNIDVSSGTQALARGLGQVGEAFEAKARRDAEAEANSLDAQITGEWNQWNAEARRQYQGSKAGEYEIEAAKWWESVDKRTGAASPLAQRRLQDVLQRRRIDALSGVVNYANAEKDRHADQAAEAAAAAAADMGIDSGNVAGARQDIIKITAQQGARKGWEPEQIQAEMQRRLGAMHLAQFTRLVEVDAERARAYYDQNKGEIPLAAQGRVEQVLKAEGDNQFATTFAAARAGQPLSEQIKAAGEIKDPERREKTLQQIKLNKALVDEAQREREAAASDAAWQLFSQGKKIPELTLSQMNGRERAQLHEAQRARADRLAAGAKPPKTDMVTYIDLRERLARGEAVNLRAFTEKVAQADMEKLLDIQTASSKPGERDALYSTQQRTDAALVGLGIDPKRQPEEAKGFMDVIDQRIRAASNAKGKKLTPDEEQQIIDSVTLDKVYVDSWGPDGDAKPVTLLQPDELAGAYVKVQGKNVKVSSVPPDDRRQIIQALRATGRQPTEQAIVDLYLRGQQQPPPTQASPTPTSGVPAPMQIPPMTDYLRLAQEAAPAQPDRVDGNNPYLDLARSDAQGQQARARTVLETALKDDPEIAAERQRLSKTSGVPLRVVERNLDELRIKEQARMVDLARMAQESPVLYRQLVDPTFTTIAQDDLPTLTKIERAINGAFRYATSGDMKRSLTGDVARGSADVLAGGTMGLGEGIFNLTGAVYDLVGADQWAADMRGRANRSREARQGFGLQPESSTGEAVKSGLGSAGTNLALLPAGLQRGLFQTAEAAALAVSGTMGTFAGADAYFEGREAGLGKGQSTVFGLTQGGFEFLLEKVPAQKLFGDIALNEPFLRALGKQLGVESVTEQATTLAQDFNAWMNLNPEKSVAEFIAERPEAAYQTFIATLVGTGVQTSTIQGINKIVEKMGDQALVFEQDRLDEMLKAAGQSALRQRSPEQFRAHMERVVGETEGAKKEVYVDAEVLAQLPPELLAQLPASVQEQIPAALEAASTVAIPMADVLTVAPGTPLEQALNDHARMAPDAPTRFEAQQAGDVLKQDAERILAQAQDQAAAQQEFEAVRADLAQQITAAGRYRPAVVESYAAGLAHFFVAYGQRTGLGTKGMYDAYRARGFRIVGEAGSQDAVLEDAGPQRPGEISVVGYHFSPQDRPVLSTAFYGTGLRGSARDEILGSADQRLRQRLSFYFDKGDGVRPEAGVGGRAHRVNLTGVYDADADPLKLRTADARAFETKLLDLGYRGYATRMEGTQPGQVVMLGQQTFRPELLGAQTSIRSDQVLEPIAREPQWQTQASGTPEQLQARLERMQANPAWQNYEIRIEGSELQVREAEGLLEQSGRDGGDTTYADTARQLLDEMDPPVLSTVAIVDGKEDAPRFRNITELAAFFTKRNRVKARDLDSPRTQAKIADALFAEALHGLTDAGNAIGWYDRKTKAALQIIADVHPELNTDEEARFAFIAMLAVTSNGLRSRDNFVIAEQLYREQWKATRRFPESVPNGGPRTNQMGEALALLNRKIDELGWQAVRDFMSGKHTAKEVRDFAGANSFFGEQAAAQVPGALFLGPKLGSFFNNLYGDFSTVTMDRWFMRTVNRIRGQMLSLPASFTKNLGVLREQIQSGVDTFGVKADKILAEIAAYEQAPIEQQQDVLYARTKLRALQQYVRARHREYARPKDDGTGKKRSFLERTPENYLAKNLDLAMSGSNDAPSAASDRTWIRGVIEQVQQRFADAGIEISNADLQAVLWYYEKDLYAKLIGRGAEEVQLEEDAEPKEAEDYETAARFAVGRLQRAGVAAGPAGPARPDAAGAAGTAARAGGTLAQGALNGQPQPTGDRAGRYSSGSLAPLEGAPLVAGATGPDARLVAVAEQYALENGIDLKRQGAFVEVDEDRARRIAAAYEAMQHAPNDPAVKEAYEDLARQTLAQYLALQRAGYVFYLVDETNDPYAGNPWNAMRDLRANQSMGVFATEAGFGTSSFDPEGNPLLADTGLEWGYGTPDGPKKRVLFNDLFRAVHDAFGHGLEGAGFRARGEENAWQAHVRLFTGPAVGAITSETRGQNSWLNYGPHGEANQTAKVEDTVFADQKTGLMPSWTWEEGRAPDAVNSSAEAGTYEAVPSANSSVNSPLEQNARGTFNPRTLELVLGPDSDLSTLWHEMGHFFLEVLADVATQPNAPAQIASDYAAVLGWFGVTPEQWKGFTLDQKRNYHEQWARAVEAYVIEGKVPNAELAPLMRRFSAWLKAVYGSIKQMIAGLPPEQRPEINDDIRRVMDRMLATDEQIAQANEVAGLTPDEAADAEANDRLRKRSMADLKWTVKARDKVIRELQKKAAGIRKEIEAEVTVEANQTPEMRAKTALDALRITPEYQGILDVWNAERETAAKDERARLVAELYAANPDVVGLKKGQLLAKNKREISNKVDAFLIEWDKANPKPARPVNMTDEDMATVADSFGYPSVNDMLEAISAFGSKQDYIEGRTEQRMLEEHGDLMNEDSIKEAANEAVHNTARARSLASELRTQAEMLGTRTDTGQVNAKGARVTVNALVEAAKQFGANVVGRTPLRDLKGKAWQHTAAERRASKRWQEATAAGKTQDAVQAKQDQVLNNAAAKAALDAHAEGAKILEFFARVLKGKDETVVEKGRDPDIVNAARAVLQLYGLQSPASKGAAAYLEALRRNDPDTWSAIEPMVAAASANAQPILSMTFDELVGLSEQIQAMWFLAKRSRQMEVSGDLMDIDDLADDLLTRLEEIGIPDRIPGEGRAVTKAEERGLFLKQGIAFLRRVEQWAEGMDGKYGGPFLRYVFQPVKDAADRYRKDRIAYRKRFQALVDNLAPIVGNNVIAAPELGYAPDGGVIRFGDPGSTAGTAMNEILHALLHTGNESNKRKLLVGRGWATEGPNGELDTSRWDAFVQRLVNEGKLEKAHYDFLQGVWDLMESTKPLAQKTHRDVFGRYFAEVTAEPFVDPFGVARSGGYVPAQVDPRLVKDNALKKLAEEENNSMAFAFPQPAKGFTMSRVEGYNRPLMLDLRTLSQHLDKVLLFAHMTPATRGVRKLLTSKKVGTNLDRVQPAAIETMLQPWLQRSAQQVVETPVVGASKWARIPSIVRARAGMALMFANVSNTIQQITGLSSAAVRIKPAHLTRALAQFVASPREFTKAVWDASPYMDDRAKNEVAIMNEQMQGILVNPNPLERAQSWSMRHAYFLQTAFDNVLSPIVWAGAYNQALADGMTDTDAVKFADGTVRQTQGSTLPEDVSRFETGPAYARMFTQFIGYFNMMANTNGTALKQIADEVGLKKGAGRAFYVVLMGLLVPIWVAEAIAQAFRGGPEDDEKDGYLDDWLAAVFGFGTVKGLLAQIPIIGQAAGLAAAKMDNSPVNDRISLSPGLSLIESAVGGNFQTAIEALDPDKEINAQRAIRDAATLASLLTGVPVYGAARPVGYLAGVADGRIDPTGPVDLARGVVTGTASPESKQR